MNSQTVKITTSEKINLLSNLGTMLSSSIPILESVVTLLEDSKGNLKFFLTMLKDDLVNGNQINTTFAKFPKSFNRVVVNLIKGAEESGTLETVLKDIKNNIQKESEFSDKIKSAMIYPLIILFVLTGIILMILVVVIPKVGQIFTRLKVNLPMTTKIMIAMSDFLIHKYYYLIFGLVVLVLILVFLFKEKKQLIVNFLLSIPIISKFSIKIDLTRFCRNFALLLSSGLPIATALEYSQDVVTNKHISSIIKQGKEMLTSGKAFSGGLKNNKKYIPNMMVKLIEVGEKSGTLEKSMSDAAEYMDYEVSKNLKALTAMIEPAMLILVSVMVGVVVISVIGPMYSMMSQVGTRH